MLRLKEYRSSNGSGGASSSKKLKMEQPTSKSAQTKHERSRHTPAVLEEDEDVIESPEGSDQEYNHRR